MPCSLLAKENAAASKNDCATVFLSAASGGTGGKQIYCLQFSRCYNFEEI
jgi:hypothetical protein